MATRWQEKCDQTAVDICPHCLDIYCMFVLSSSDRRLYEFTTYLGPLKNCCPKFVHKLVCQKQPKSVQPAQPTGQCCQKKNFKKAYYISHSIFIYVSLWFFLTFILKHVLKFVVYNGRVSASRYRQKQKFIENSPW